MILLSHLFKWNNILLLKKCSEHVYGAMFWFFLSAVRVLHVATITQCVQLGALFEIGSNLSFFLRFGRLDGDFFAKVHHVATVLASACALFWFNEEDPLQREGARNIL